MQNSAPISPALTEPQISALVDRFYEQVRRDPQLGPVFNPAVDDWDEHKRLLTSFWASVALGARSYRGNPMAKHHGHGIAAEHFERWLQLWRATCAQVLDEPSARQMVEYAERIGRSLRYGLGIGDRARGLGLPVVDAG